MRPGGRPCGPRGHGARGPHHRRASGPLHRRVFLWFGITIVASALATALVTWLIADPASGWRRERARVDAFVSGRFERVWDRPAEREELRAAMERDLEASVRLVPLDGGERACARPLSMPVARAGAPLGAVEVCLHRTGVGWLRVLPFVAAALVLWAASGKVSRHLARPLRDLAGVARELGDGNLAARAAVRPHHPEEIRELAATVNEMAERIERQIAGQRELLAAVSHEIRTPLQRIQLLLALAEGDQDAGARARHAADVEGEIREIDALVGELLAASRLDFSVVDLRALDAAGVAARALERADVDPSVLSVELEDRAFQGDPTLVARALSNLIDNAKKYGDGVAELRVFRGEGPEPTIVFEVRDRGPGFPAGQEERVFQPFVRASGQPDQGTSLGLGLALVRRIAEAHGGRALARSAPEGGGVVALELPQAPVSAPVAA